MSTATEFRRITPEEVIASLRAIDAIPIRRSYYAPPGAYDEQACACGLGAVMLAERKRKGEDAHRFGLFVGAHDAVIELGLNEDYVSNFEDGFDSYGEEYDLESAAESDPRKQGFLDGARASRACAREFPRFPDADKEDDVDDIYEETDGE
jgi:hypothetical protein